MRARLIHSVVFGLVAVLSTAAVVRQGGGTDPRPSPPSAPRVDGSGAAARERSDYEVAIRLIERLKDARIDAPNAKSGQGGLGAHWRKLPGLAMDRAAIRQIIAVALDGVRSGRRL